MTWSKMKNKTFLLKAVRPETLVFSFCSPVTTQNAMFKLYNWVKKLIFFEVKPTSFLIVHENRRKVREIFTSEDNKTYTEDGDESEGG